MAHRPRKRSLYDAYRFPGFTPARELKGVFGDPKARVIRLNRRSKKQSAVLVVQSTVAGTTKRPGKRATFLAETTAFTWSSRSVALIAGCAKP